MDIELNDLLTIDDKEYAVKNITIVEEKTYYILININDIVDFKFCYLEDNELYEEFDKEIVLKIIANINLDFNNLDMPKYEN